MKGLLAVLAKAGKGDSSDEEGSPASGDDAGKDYKTIAKDAAKDGDWDAMIDALCAYIDQE